jgi:hypothetical protein
MLPFFSFSAQASIYMNADRVDNSREVQRRRTPVMQLWISLALLIRATGAFAEQIAIPEPEAPTVVFATKLGSVDVDLSLLGSWTAGVSLGTGILLVPGLQPQLLDSFPSMSQGFLFSQTPDITASLTLLNRYFLDVSVLGSFADNSIQLGYRGATGEALQSVVLGTKGITIAPSRLLSIPEQARGSLGASATLISGLSTNNLLLRWDAEARKSKTFVGKNELVEQEISVDAYTRGRYFFLPDTAIDQGTLQVYLEDMAGTVQVVESAGLRRYRLAGFDDVVLDSALGLVSLRSPAKGRVLVYYRKQGAGVGTAAGMPGLPDDTGGYRNPGGSARAFSWLMPNYLGQAIAARKVTLPVGDCLLLWEPGDSSPFEIGSSYEFASEPPADQSRIAFRLVIKDTAAVLPTGLRFRSIPEEKRFMVLRDPDLGSAAFRFWNFYPFDDPTAGLLYGPKRDSIAGALGFAIVAQFLSPVDDLILEPEVIPGSVQVRVNGMPETRFEVDAGSGRLTMLAPLLPTDRVEVSYSKAQQGLSGGDILFAWVGRIPFSDAANIALSAGLRWNADPWSVSQQAYSKSGTVIVTAGIGGKAGPFTYDAQAGAAYTNPDTSGILRLFGMEAGSLGIDTSEDNAFPASAPDPAEHPGLAGSLQGNRGQLLYRDYRQYGALGSVTLLPISTTPAPDPMPYTSGNRMGPYAVAGTDGNLAGQSLVLEYSLAASQWAGTQIAISAGADTDLSAARALTVRWRLLGAAGTAQAYVQLGAVSEDLDGTGASTGTPKSEMSSSDAGFPFLDSSSTTVLKVGAGPKLLGNARQDSEDRNGNGVLDFEDKNRMITLVPPSPGASWTSFTYSFSDADRQKLVSARSIRILIKEGLGAAASGRLVIDTISMDTTPFWPQTAAVDRPIVQVRQTSESLALVAPVGGALVQKFADTYRRFHPNGEANQVLETSWSAATSAGFSVRGYVAQGTGGIQYRTVIAYVRASSGNAEYSFSLLDSARKGVSWAAAVPGDNAWHELRVSGGDGSVSIDGVAIPGAPVFDAAYGNLSFLQVDAPVQSGAGSLYIDEVYCTDPLGSFGAALVGTLTAQFPGTLLAIGGAPLLANLVIREDLSLISAGFAPLYGPPAGSEDLSSRTEVSAEALFSRVSANVQLRHASGTFQAAGGHRLTVPSSGAPFSLTDAFSVDWTGGFARENGLSLSLGQIMSAGVTARADAALATGTADAQLNQAWQATLGSNALTPVAIASAIDLSQSILGYPLVADWYGGRWAKEAALLLPWGGGADLVRHQGLDVRIGMPAAPVGFEAEAKAISEGTLYTAAGFRQTSTGILSLKLSFNLGPGDAPDGSVGFSYTRSAVLATTPGPGPRFEAESAELSRVLALQPYLLTSIPFLELFADLSGSVLPGWQSAAAAQASYAPTLSLSLQRSYGARLLDLIVPSGIELSLGQELKKAGDLTQAATSIKPKASTHAVNLFGSLGAYPMLPLFRTDEYSANVSASLDGSPGQAMRLSSIGVEAYATLMGDQETSFTLLESFNRKEAPGVSLGNDVQAILDWAVHPIGGIPLPLLPAEIGKSGKLLHRERAQLTVAWQDSGAFHPLTLVLGHATTLAYEGHGTIKGSLDVGLDAENLGALGLAWRVAVRAALEAKLTF